MNGQEDRDDNNLESLFKIGWERVQSTLDVKGRIKKVKNLVENLKLHNGDIFIASLLMFKGSEATCKSVKFQICTFSLGGPASCLATHSLLWDTVYPKTIKLFPPVTN